MKLISSSPDAHRGILQRNLDRIWLENKIKCWYFNLSVVNKFNFFFNAEIESAA